MDSKNSFNNQNKTDTFTILKPNEFLKDIALRASKAKKRIWIKTMYLEPGVVTKKLIQIFEHSGNKNLNKKIYVDYFGLLTSNGNPDYIKRLLSRIARRLLGLKEKSTSKDLLFTKLRKIGINVIFTNPPSLFEKVWPYYGRNHMKIIIIDDLAYLGGLDFSDRSFLNIDFMVKIKDIKIVDAIIYLVLMMDNKRLFKNKIISVNNETSLFVDIGKSGKSLILKQAVDLALKARKSIYHSNQFAPDGEFLTALNSAYKRGVLVKVIVPKKNEFNKIFSLIHSINQITMWIKNQKIPIIYYPYMIHAKLTIIDEKIVLFGSHNLSEKGEIMNTDELAILSSNKELVNGLLRFYKDLGSSK